jgi:hypothetical protein
MNMQFPQYLRSRRNLTDARWLQHDCLLVKVAPHSGVHGAAMDSGNLLFTAWLYSVSVARLRLTVSRNTGLPAPALNIVKEAEGPHCVDFARRTIASP